jgi:hypothetical protein
MPSKIFAAVADVIERAPASERSETADGFIVAVTPKAARRQLRFSLGAMGLMAAGAAALIAANGLPAQAISSSPAHKANMTQLVVQPTFVRSVTAARAADAPEAAQGEIQKRHQDRNAPRG